MNLEFADAVRKYVGLRWVHQGRSKTQGVDCLGLVVLAARDCGYDVEDCDHYRRRPDDKKLLYMVDKQMDRVPEGAPLEPGDILLIHFNGRTKSPYHFAVVDKDPERIIHGHAPYRRVVTDLTSEWVDNVSAVYRLPEKK